MWESITALQTVILAALLLWAARVKLFGRSPAAALNRLLGNSFAPAAYRIVGGVEAVVALTLLIPPMWTFEPAAVLTLSTGYLGYLIYSARVTPDASCGCLGAAAVRISWRSYARVGVMMVASGALLAAPVSWTEAAAASPSTALLVIALETAGFVALSPEFDRFWRGPHGAATASPPPPESDTMSLQASVFRLHSSTAYRRAAGWLLTDVTEFWDEDDWRVICYGARYADRDCTAVFAVPLPHNHTDLIKLAVVDEGNGETLLTSPAATPAA